MLLNVCICVSVIVDNMANVVWVWDMQKMNLEAVLEQTSAVRCFQWDPRRPRLALCTANTKLYLWSPAGCVSVQVPSEGNMNIHWELKCLNYVVVTCRKKLVHPKDFPARLSYTKQTQHPDVGSNFFILKIVEEEYCKTRKSISWRKCTVNVKMLKDFARKLLKKTSEFKLKHQIVACNSKIVEMS